MKKRLAFLLAAAVLAFAACAPASGPAASSSSAPAAAQSAAPSAATGETAFAPVTFTDALGREVTVGSRPQRAAVLIGSFADVWCLAGGRDTLVAAADDTWAQFELDLPETVVNIGAVKEPSAEALLAAQPDFIIASANTAADVDLLPTLEKAGIPTAYFQVSTFEDYLQMLELCTRITGQPDRYERNGTAVQAQVDAAKALAAGYTAQNPAPTVLYVRASASGCVVKGSQGNVLGEMLAALGCTNIADNDANLLENLSMEAILAADPDCIFFVMQGRDDAKCQQSIDAALMGSPAWQQLTAVQSGRVYYMDQKLYNLKPNARWGEAYQNLAEILYGDAQTTGAAG